MRNKLSGTCYRLCRRFVDWFWEPHTSLTDEERAEDQIYGGP